VRKIHFITLIAALAVLLTAVASAATFKLNDGTTVTGDLIESGSNDASALIGVGDGKYERVAWGQFSQEDLKAFMTKFAGNKKIIEAVEPFIEVTQEERAKKTEVTIKPADPVVTAMQAERAEPKSSLIGSLFKSGLGWFLVLLVYGANIFAGYEIAIFRARPVPLVAGLAAIPFLGFISNIVFLALPTYVAKKSAADLAFEEQLAAEPQTFAVPGAAEAAAEAAAQAEAKAQQAASGPPPETFARGQFTFNKRFFETKFPNFFGIARREEDRKKTLVFKTSKGEFIAQRITRIASSDIHIQVERNGATMEVQLQFVEIQEITLRHN
jgi:hypothetical protein